MNAKKAELFVSVIVPVHHEGTVLEDFAAEALETLQRHYGNYELVIIDDGSTDGTAAAAGRLLESRKCVRYLRLARHYGRETAVAAGLDTVIGDYAVIMTPSTDPVDLIPKTVAQAAAGTGVVFGVKGETVRLPLLGRLASNLFHWYCRRCLGFMMPRRMTGFAVLSRQAINSLIKVRGKGNYLRLLQKYTGLAVQEFPYEPRLRAGSRWHRDRLGHRLNTAIDIVVSNSSHPLRSLTYLGLAASGFNVLYMVYIVAVYLTKQNIQPGWTTSSMQSAVMFFFLFLILTVFAEYLGKLMKEVTPRDPYTVVEEKASSIVLADPEHLNVVDKTEREDYERIHH